jgi:hypothetical protein
MSLVGTPSDAHSRDPVGFAHPTNSLVMTDALIIQDNFAHTFTFSRRNQRPSYASLFVPRKIRGRRECRVYGHTRSLVCESKKHTSKVTTGSPIRSGIPCAMVLRLIS